MQSAIDRPPKKPNAANGEVAGLFAQGQDRARSRTAHPVGFISRRCRCCRPKPSFASHYGASRTALRDALLTLAAKGLIEARKRAGTRVRPPSDWNRLDAQVLEWMGEIEPDLDFVRGLIEARLVIEPAAAQLAASMASSGDLAVIEAAYHAMCSAPEDDLAACLDADVRFHTGILRASRNPVFANLGNMLAAALSFSFRLTTSATANYQRDAQRAWRCARGDTHAARRRRA